MVHNLENVIEFVFFFTMYFDRQWGLGHTMPVGHVLLGKVDVENVVSNANQLQKLHAVGLRAYLLNDWIESVELMVKLHAWILYSDVLS